VRQGHATPVVRPHVPLAMHILIPLSFGRTAVPANMPTYHSMLPTPSCACLTLPVLLQVLMDAQVLGLAVMTDLLSGDQRRRYSDLIDSPFMPALRAPVPLSHVDRPKKLPTAPQVRCWPDLTAGVCICGHNPTGNLTPPHTHFACLPLPLCICLNLLLWLQRCIIIINTHTDIGSGNCSGGDLCDCVCGTRAGGWREFSVPCCKYKGIITRESNRAGDTHCALSLSCVLCVCCRVWWRVRLG
jgi:hypothetical protein